MYKTTVMITSLAGNGSRIKAHSVVTEAMFSGDQWDALLQEGAVTLQDIAKPEPEQPAPAKRKTVKNA